MLVAAQPTWGVDIGASAQIRQALLDLRDAGAAVLVVSEELDELFEIADRIAVLSQGRLSEALPASETDAERIGMLMGAGPATHGPAARSAGHSSAATDTEMNGPSSLRSPPPGGLPGGSGRPVATEMKRPPARFARLPPRGLPSGSGRPIAAEMRLRLEARPEPSRLAAWLSPLLAALAMALVGVAVFAAFGKDPWTALHVFFVKPLATRYGVGEWLQKAGPLMLCAGGLAVGYRANVWNIGAEGQLTLGGLAAGGLALAFDASPSSWLLPAMLVAGAAGGMAWAALPALLRTRFNANEVLTSLMLVYVASHLLAFLVHGPWRDPEGFNFPQSKMFIDSALLPIVLPGTAAQRRRDPRRSGPRRSLGVHEPHRASASRCGSPDWHPARRATPASRAPGPCGWACWRAAPVPASPA